MLIAPQPWNVADPAAASGASTIEGSLPEPREAASAVFDGAAVYVFGGEGALRLSPDTDGNHGHGNEGDKCDVANPSDNKDKKCAGRGLFPDIVLYDPVSRTSTLLDAKLPSGLTSTAGALVDGKAFVVGGRTPTGPTAEIVVFDPADQSVAVAGQLPSPRQGAAAATNGDDVFVFGGLGTARTNEIVRFDPDTGTATVMTSRLPTARDGMAAVSTGRFIFLFGGSDGARLDDVLRYDTLRDRIATMASALPSARDGLSGIYAAPFMFLLGGSGDGGFLAQTLRYHPGADSLAVLDATLPTGRDLMAGVALGADALLLGGRDGSGRLGEVVRVGFGAGAPQNLVARSGPMERQITLTWEPPVDDGLSGPIVGYRIYRGVEPGRGSAIAEVDGATLAYLDDGLPHSSIRYYTVVALTATGEGAHSNEAHASTFDVPPPPLPSARHDTESVWTGDVAFVFGGQAQSGAVAGPLSPHRTDQLDAPGDEEPLDEIVSYDPGTGEVTVLGTTLPPKCCQVVELGGGEGDEDRCCEEGLLPGALEQGSIGESLLAYLFGGDGERCCEDEKLLGSDGAGLSSEPTDLLADGIFAFDPATETIRELDAVLPRGDCNVIGLSTGDLIYLFATACGEGDERCCEEEGFRTPGSDQVLVGDIWRFDPATETIVDTGNLVPDNCCAAAVFSGATGLGFLFGQHGFVPAPPNASADAAGALLEAAEGECDVYVFDAGSESVVPSEPCVSLPKCCFDGEEGGDGSIVLFGGEDGEERCCEDSMRSQQAPGDPMPSDQILLFDPVSRTMRVLEETLPTARSDVSTVWSGQRFLVFGGDEGEQSTEDVFGYHPGQPQAPQATPGPDAGMIRLTWSAPADGSEAFASGYFVYAGDAPDALERVRNVSTDTHSITETGLGDGRTRYYRVTLFDETDEGPQSQEASATTFSGPSAPRNLEASCEILNDPVGCDTEGDPLVVRLAWDPPEFDGGDSVDEYRIYRHTDLEPDHAHYATVDGSTTEYTDAECDVPAASCFYTVTAVNAVGEGPHSNEAAALGTSPPGRDAVLASRQAAVSSEAAALPTFAMVGAARLGRA